METNARLEAFPRRDLCNTTYEFTYPLRLPLLSVTRATLIANAPPSPLRRVSNVINGEVTFGLVPREHWYQPDWINETRATAGREKMVADNIIYGGSVSYRNMCRFNSGVRRRVSGCWAKEGDR